MLAFDTSYCARNVLDLLAGETFQAVDSKECVRPAFLHMSYHRDARRTMVFKRLLSSCLHISLHSHSSVHSIPNPTVRQLRLQGHQARTFVS